MRNDVSSGKKTGTLWTRDFTIITVGSVISMLGNSVSGFAMSLLVLDISQSTFLYAVYLAMYTLPQLVMPVIFGAVLDRFSRRKMIYTLDFLSSGLYLMMAIVLAGGWFSFPLFAVYCFVIGSIQSIYMVAYESFYPLLITEGFFQKAYSIASVLETFTAVMVPVSAFLYGKIGLAPLLAVNAVCFFLAAVMETQIRAKEQYIEKQQNRLEEKVPYRRQIFADIRDGFAYLVSEKGLLIVAVYFAISSVCGGTSWTLTLPYFRNTFEHGEYIYMLVWGTMLAARSLGGLFHYRWSIPAAWRYMIAGKFLPAVRTAYCRGNEAMDLPTEIEFCSGCFMLIRTELFKKLGGFDERYFLYMEDADLSRRVRQEAKVIFFPGAKVTHAWHHESAKSGKALKLHIESARKYFAKWRKRP